MNEQMIKDLKNEMLSLYERSTKIDNEQVSEEIYELQYQPMVFELMDMYVRINGVIDLAEVKRVGEQSDQKYFMEDYVYPIGTLYYEIVKEIRRITGKVA